MISICKLEQLRAVRGGGTREREREREGCDLAWQKSAITITTTRYVHTGGTTTNLDVDVMRMSHWAGVDAVDDSLGLHEDGVVAAAGEQQRCPAAADPNLHRGTSPPLLRPRTAR